MSKARPNENNVRQGQTIYLVVINHMRNMPLQDSFVAQHFVSSHKKEPTQGEVVTDIPVHYLRKYLKEEGNRYVFFTKNQAKKALLRHLAKIESEQWIDEQEAILKRYDFKLGDVFEVNNKSLTILNIKFTSQGVIVTHDTEGVIEDEGLVEFTTMLKNNGCLDKEIAKCH